MVTMDDWRDWDHEVSMEDLNNMRRFVCLRCGRVCESLYEPLGWGWVNGEYLCPWCRLLPGIRFVERG